jgi:hypothetical protein
LLDEGSEGGNDKADDDEPLKVAPPRSTSIDRFQQCGRGEGAYTRTEAVAGSRHPHEQMAKIRKKFEEERIQVAGELKSLPAADARPHMDLCCALEGSSEDQRTPLPVEPARQAEATETDGTIFRFPNCFRPPPGLELPPGLSHPFVLGDIPLGMSIDDMPPVRALPQTCDATLNELRTRSSWCSLNGKSDDETQAGSKSDDESSHTDDMDWKEVPTVGQMLSGVLRDDQVIWSRSDAGWRSD